MGAEFVVDSALWQNLKFKDLGKRLAGLPNAAWCLIRLWSFTAANRPDGNLTGVDPAEMHLTETEFRALVDARGPKSECGFIYVEGEYVAVHDWERSSKHQTSLERRRSAARIAGLASAAQRQDLDTTFIQTRALLVGPPAAERSDKEILSTAGNGDGAHPPSPAAHNKAVEKWLDDGFNWFYEIYPHKVGKFPARKAWGRLHRILLISDGCKGISMPLKRRIFEHIQDKLRSGEWEPTPEKKKYIPAPAVYLNQRRWEE